MSDSVRPHRRQPTRLPHPWDSPGKNTGMGCHFLLQCIKVKSQSEVTQSCPTLRDPMDCSPSGSSVHGIFQARVLEWGAIAFSGQKSYLLLIPDHHLLLGNNLFCFVIHTVFYLQLTNFRFIVLLYIYFGYLLYLLTRSSKTLNFLTFGPRLKCLFFSFSLLSSFSFISTSFILFS